MKPILGAIAVVIHESHVLLVQRAKAPDVGKWSYPGGGVELGETALDAALRELHEETTIIGAAPEYFTNVDVIARDDHGQVAHHFLLAVVHCNYVSGQPIAGDDAADARWVPLAQVAQLDTSASVTTVLEQALTLKHRKMDLDPSPY